MCNNIKKHQSLHYFIFHLHILDTLLYVKATLFQFLDDSSNFFKCQNFSDLYSTVCIKLVTFSFLTVCLFLWLSGSVWHLLELVRPENYSELLLLIGNGKLQNELVLANEIALDTLKVWNAWHLIQPFRIKIIMSRLMKKTTKWHVCPEKTLISLGIHPV